MMNCDWFWQWKYYFQIGNTFDSASGWWEGLHSRWPPVSTTALVSSNAGICRSK